MFRSRWSPTTRTEPDVSMCATVATTSRSSSATSATAQTSSQRVTSGTSLSHPVTASIVGARIWSVPPRALRARCVPGWTERPPTSVRCANRSAFRRFAATAAITTPAAAVARVDGFRGPGVRKRTVTVVKPSVRRVVTHVADSIDETYILGRIEPRSTAVQIASDPANCFSHATRRGFLKTAGIATAAALLSAGPFARLAYAAALTQAQRDKLTPDEIIEMMKRGNERFRSGKKSTQDFLAQQRASAAGQYPAAVILSCIDSRASAETIMDLAIGDVFNARVAGNIANDDILGSMEFACAAAGAKVVLVMGHTACGAIKGAIDDVQLGNLTGLLAKIQPAVKATAYQGDRSAKNSAFVDAVARRNVELTMENIRKGSAVLDDLKAKGAIKIAGAMYDIASAKVDFFS